MRRGYLFFFLSLVLLNGLSGEVFEHNIYGEFKGFLKENIPQAIKQGELWAVPAVPIGNPFLIGWELELLVNGLETNSKTMPFMLSFFSSPRPYPHEMVGTYRICDKGTKILNTGNSFFFQILDLQWATANQWQVIALRAGEYPLLVRVEPSFQSPYKEATSTSAYNFVVKIRPIYNEKGIINFEIFDQDTKDRLEEVKICIDDKAYFWPCKETIFQNKGIYQVIVQAEGYESKSVQIQVEPGRDNYIHIPLQRAYTYLFFNVLGAVEVFLDARPITLEEREKGVKVESGLHTLTFMLGSYKATRSIYVKRGLKYEVSSTFSFDCKELP